MKNAQYVGEPLRQPMVALCAAVFLICTTQLANAFCLFSCDPTEENGRQTITNLLQGQFQTAVSVTDFKKTNGVKSTFAGVDHYELQYQARLDLPQGFIPKPAEGSRVTEELMTSSKGMTKWAELQMLEPAVRLGKAIVSGQKWWEPTSVAITGTVRFRKTEKGWQGPDGGVY